MGLKQILAHQFGRGTALLGWPVHAAIWRGVRLFDRQSLVRFTGETHAGRPGVLLGAGDFTPADFLVGTFFVGPTERQELGLVSAVHLARRLEAAGDGADLIVARLDRLAGRAWLPVGRYQRMPEWVGVSRAIPPSLEGYASGNAKVRRELRRVAKGGFGVLESREPADFERFYERMMRPYVAVRHGWTPGANQALRRSFERGALLWCTLGEKKIAGTVVEVAGRRLMIRCFGVLEGDETLMRRGALAACYVQAFEYGRRRGCTTIDFGGSRPTPTDGTLRYKLGWEVQFDSRPSSSVDYFIRWPAGNASVAAMLRAVPLIVPRGAGHGLLAAGADWPPRWVPADTAVARDGQLAMVTP